MVKKVDKDGVEIITADSLTKSNTDTINKEQGPMDELINILSNGSRLLDQIDNILSKSLAMKNAHFASDTLTQSSQSNVPQITKKKVNADAIIAGLDQILSVEPDMTVAQLKEYIAKNKEQANALLSRFTG